jgi:hypothetical protein
VLTTEDYFVLGPFLNIVIARSDSDEAIPTASADKLWIASLRSQ